MAVLDHEGTYSIMYGPFGIPIGAGYRPGYVARPDKAGRFPVVIVIPAIEGLGSHEKDLCRDLARHGFAAITLDLYRTRSGDPLEDYHALSDRSALVDLDEAHEFLQSEDVDWAHADAVGVLGLDVGGRFALTLAARRPWVRAVVACYTPLTGDEEREVQVADLLDHLGVAVLGLYGAEDDLVETSSVDEAQRRNDHGQWLLYDGAGHGFLDIDSENYEPNSAADAESRIFQFFAHTLPPAETLDLG